MGAVRPMGVPGRAESADPTVPAMVPAPMGPQAESRCCCCCIDGGWFRKPPESGRMGATAGCDREPPPPIGRSASWEAGAEPGLVAWAVCCTYAVGPT